MSRPQNKPPYWSIAALLALATTVTAQRRLSLDGTWDIAAEPRDEARSYDRKVAVPGPFEAELGTAFDGVAWYRRLLPLAGLPRGRVRVEFAAVATHAQVFCNGQPCGEHLGGWTPFRVELGDGLRFDGSDVLEVRVDERVGHNTQGFLPIVQPHFGGIWQSVTLCVDQHVVLDRHSVFVFGKGDGALQAEVATLPADGAAGEVELSILDGARVLASERCPVQPGERVRFESRVPQPRRWSPANPHRYRARFRLLQQDGTELDRIDTGVGFRDLAADGTVIRWNGDPLCVRGVLHWGFSPPHLAPPTDEAFWRRQLEDFRSLGFNLVKCCLWVPPRRFYELCDEIGLLVWQEYPTWHPKMDQQHKAELLREYAEFFVHDRSSPSVAFRSLTCETGHGADLDVISALFTACKAAVPDTLVVDDSSWIGWQRIADFFDEHPYGNNRWWPRRLQDFRRHLQQHGPKPLLLGECIAADTWVDRAAWQRAFGTTPPWWRPDCLADQERFENWVAGQFGAATLATLGPIARDYGLRTRRYQIERLRLSLPEAGYVVSVARDFPKARMGLYDDFDQLKWSADDWAFQRDAMLCLDTPGDRRAFVVKEHAPTVLQARLVAPAPAAATASPGSPAFVATAVALPPLPVVSAPTRHRLQARHGDIAADWHVWLLPPWDDARPDGVRVADRLDPDTLSWIERGGRLLLRAGGQERSWKSEAKWYLTGAPFAPPHPVHAALPADMLVELQPFDLDGGRLLPWQHVRDQVDPILAFWETHDIAEVRAHLFAFDARVGAGRLLVSAFDTTTEAGRYVEHQLLRHLASGPAPQRELAPTTVAALHGLLTERRIDLSLWRFRTDADDRGRAGNWHDPKTDVATAEWRDLKAGSHWENQAEDLKHYTGIAWYRVDVLVPEDWQGRDARVVFEGVDDSFEFWLNGEPAGSFGDPVTRRTIWLERQVAELGQRLRPGATNTLVLRVVDHAGSGGLWKPVYLTTGPADAASRLLH